MNRRRFLEISAGAALLPAAGCAGSLVTAGGEGRAPGARARLRDLGIAVGDLPPGRHNAITDVPGVAVGHTTLIRGDGPLVRGQGPIRTGATAVLPHRGDLAAEPVAAADFNLNGNGELTGLGPLRRTGFLGAPVLLTDTGSVGVAYSAALAHLLASSPQLFERPFRPEPVVGETWGDFLHDTAGGHLRVEHVRAAIDGAAGGPVAEGSVGGGTAMRAYRFKAGIGTASRLVQLGDRTCALGVLVQANCGRRDQLTVLGVPVGREMADLLPERGPGGTEPAAGNSLLVIVATDAPLLPLQLGWLCKRAALGLARTGGTSTHGSGDLMLAFSTAARGPVDGPRELELVRSSQVDPLLSAAVEATEEAILNSLTAAETMVGRDGNTIHALPLDRLVAVMARYGRLK
ncbi:MAG: P1 family peptidase [Gemmatimonadota bacterium]